MAKKKKLGRPPKPKDQRQMATVSFRLLKEERRMIGLAADACGEKLSEWIRATLIGAADAAMVEQGRGGDSNPNVGTSDVP